MLSRALEAGAARQCPDNNCGPRLAIYKSGKTELWQVGWNPQTGGLGPIDPNGPTQTFAHHASGPNVSVNVPISFDEEIDTRLLIMNLRMNLSLNITFKDTLSDCLKNALRGYFPKRTAQGKEFSPVDDAQFSAGLPAWLKAANFVTESTNRGKAIAVTLGLYDIHYDTQAVSLSGGSLNDLETIIEELAHTVQFIGLWASLNERDPVTSRRLTADETYTIAQGAWQTAYIKETAKAGVSYNNAIEKAAKDRTAQIITDLRNKDRALGQYFQVSGTICDFKLYK